MEKSLRPKRRPARFVKLMPGDELPSNRVMTEDEPMRPRRRPVKLTPGDELQSNRVMTEDEYAGGGMVRGCKGDQVSGKGFRGTY